MNNKLIVVLTAALMLGIVGCSKEGDSTNDANAPNQSQMASSAMPCNATTGQPLLSVQPTDQGNIQPQSNMMPPASNESSAMAPQQMPNQNLTPTSPTSQEPQTSAGIPPMSPTGENNAGTAMPPAETMPTMPSAPTAPTDQVNPMPGTPVSPMPQSGPAPTAPQMPSNEMNSGMAPAPSVDQQVPSTPSTEQPVMPNTQQPPMDNNGNMTSASSAANAIKASASLDNNVADGDQDLGGDMNDMDSNSENSGSMSDDGMAPVDAD